MLELVLMVVIGGLVAATGATLLVLPVLYNLLGSSRPFRNPSLDPDDSDDASVQEEAR